METHTKPVSQDRKLVASKQDYEVEYIAKKFRMTHAEVMQVMKDLGKDGSYCRSRKKIYAKIREMQKPGI